MRVLVWATILLHLQSFYINTVVSTKCSGSGACSGQTNVTIYDGSCNGGSGVCQSMSSSTVQSGSCNSTSCTSLYCTSNYQCSYMKNTNVESGSCNGGAYACSYMDSSAVGSGSCNGGGSSGYTCFKMSNTTVGKSSCKASDSYSSYQCNSLKNSKIGDGSCLSDSACDNVVNSVIGKGSCKSMTSCQYCSYSTVPDGQCTSSSGWSNSSGHFNTCMWCSNCVTQSTGASCRTTQIPGTVTAPTVRRLNSGGTADQGVNDETCAALLETIRAFFKNQDHPDFLKINFLREFTEAKLDESINQGVCKIHFLFYFNHLEKKQLTTARDALLAAFEQQQDDFLSIHTNFPKIAFVLEAIDLNAGTTYKPKKAKNAHPKKRKHSSASAKKKNSP